MFVNIVEMPVIRRGKEKEFREWFEWSNAILQKSKGFVSRRLLEPLDGEGRYVAIVEHENERTFLAMQTSKDRERVLNRLEPLLDGNPNPHFYKLVGSPQGTQPR